MRKSASSTGSVKGGRNRAKDKPASPELTLASRALRERPQCPRTACKGRQSGQFASTQLARARRAASSSVGGVGRREALCTSPDRRRAHLEHPRPTNASEGSIRVPHRAARRLSSQPDLQRVATTSGGAGSGRPLADHCAAVGVCGSTDRTAARRTAEPARPGSLEGDTTLIWLSRQAASCTSSSAAGTGRLRR
jgi:hypothetical protein